MTGGKLYNSVMDILLDDEMYLKVYRLIERCNNFFGNYQSIQQSFFGKPELQLQGCTMHITTENMYFGQYRNDSNIAVSYLYDNIYTHQNSITSKCIIASKGAVHTDFSPLKKIVKDEIYDAVGWFVTNNIITDEIEGELFQESTVYDVYSLYEMQEIINRVKNLPLLEKQSLTIHENLRYPLYNQILDELLKGY